jgi:hypothetical protein
MRFRKLRIAWALFWGIACLLFVVMWANSNVSVDWFAVPVSQSSYLRVTSFPNEFTIGLEDKGLDNGAWHDQRSTDDWLEYFARTHGEPWSTVPAFDTHAWLVLLPYWFGVLLSATFAVGGLIFELRWHFTVRALLLATATMAFVLWLVVYALRK